ncbi:MAG: hypothetical protein HGA98_01600 [Deltaproteobacteria bacterium]|nr:hypothetical protein [Deltaproteobacteria bacterium]
MKSYRGILAGVALAAALVAGGCGGNYYIVRDASSDKVYYTQEIDRVSGGAVRFTDQRTGNTVTLQNSEIKEANEQEYTTGKNSGK